MKTAMMLVSVFVFTIVSGCQVDNEEQQAPALPAATGSVRVGVQHQPEASSSITPSRDADGISSETILFVEGRYVPQPYHVRIEGERLLINGIEKWRGSILPPGRFWPIQKDLPALPEWVRPDTPWSEIEKIKINREGWHTLFVRYFCDNFDPPEQGQKFIAALEKLPFVAKVDVIPTPEFGPNCQIVRVTSKAGDVREYNTSWWDPAKRKTALFETVAPSRPKPKLLTPEELQVQMEIEAERWRKILISGEVIIVRSDTGSIRIPPQERSHWERVVNLVRILESKLPHEQKFKDIMNWMPLSGTARAPGSAEGKIVKQLIENYRPDPQLTARIRELTPKVSIRLWTEPAK